MDSQPCYVKCIILNLVLDSIFLYARDGLSIPEGVSVMTVIIDGVDVAPAGVVKRSSYFREPRVRPVDTTIHAPLVAKQP